MTRWLNVSLTGAESFWDLNPHFIYLEPFSDLYESDKTQGSKDMWCIVWLSFPDENENPFYRLPKSELEALCKKFNPLFDKERLSEFIAVFPEKGLSTVQRLLKQMHETLTKREEFLSNVEYNFDTMKLVDEALSKSPKIWEEYKRLLQKFEEEKTNARVFGNRQATAREKKKIRPES